MKKKAVTLISASTLFLGLAIGSAAAPVMEKISANLDWSASFEVDGQAWTPQDTDGNKFAPINYNGYNYLPVRAVSEALDVAINWDGENRTIQFGERTDIVPIINANVEEDSRVIKTTDKQYTVQNGTDYESGLILNSINSAKKSINLLPERKYQTLELNFFAIDPENDIDIKIYNDSGVVERHLTIARSDAHEAVSLDIGGQEKVVIEATTKPGADEKIFVAGNYQ